MSKGERDALNVPGVYRNEYNFKKQLFHVTSCFKLLIFVHLVYLYFISTVRGHGHLALKNPGFHLFLLNKLIIS